MSGEQKYGATTPDRQLEQDLALLREADPETAAAEPPELIDRAVLNMARRALPPSGRRGRLRWLGAFATAAVVVLAFSLVLQQDPQAPPPADTDELRLDRSALSPPPPAAPSATTAAEPATAPKTRRGARAESEAPPPLAARPTGRLADEAIARELDADSPPLDPAMWVQRLLQLQRDRAYGELKTELAAFRESYPDYPLPAELQN
jgi:hypothetical protein